MNRYRKGADKERRIVKSAKNAGLIAMRSAGSKGFIDVVIIDEQKKEVLLIQCKTYQTLKLDGTDTKETKEYKAKAQHLNGLYNLRFEVW